MIDIHRYQRTSNKLASNHMDLTDDDHLARNKCESASTEANRKLSRATYTDLQVPHASEEDQSDNCEDITICNDHGNRLNSLKDLSHLSLTKESSIDRTKSVQNHENTLNTIEQRDRKDHIVKHTTGYNYDKNSTVDGLYTRIGIGSK